MMYGLLDKVFTLHKFASSRGTGVGKPHPGDEHIPVLDQDKLDLWRCKFIQRSCRSSTRSNLCKCERRSATC
ncbi:hypothetical protein DPMN_021901 [Dreissena polymorpha]|uniref:Uncharacterized protein n=1 Tax=Dreissena polymorpha TaxID=45954 RepID=A0A9D4SC45_DREPO|nr:hypothetical protein DPMN_021901 [Dreissena polymorpha]